MTIKFESITKMSLCLWHRYLNGQESEPYEADNSVVGPFFKIYYINLKGPNKHFKP